MNSSHFLTPLSSYYPESTRSVYNISCMVLDQFSSLNTPVKHQSPPPSTHSHTFLSVNHSPHFAVSPSSGARCVQTGNATVSTAAEGRPEGKPVSRVWFAPTASTALIAPTWCRDCWGASTWRPCWHVLSLGRKGRLSRFHSRRCAS